MDLKNLTTFIHVAELGSFTKAGVALGCSQSTISFQIRQLEEELEFPLFERINRTVVLTEKGREVLAYAHQINKLTAELKQNIQSDSARSSGKPVKADWPDCTPENGNNHFLPRFLEVKKWT